MIDCKDGAILSTWVLADTAGGRVILYDTGQTTTYQGLFISATGNGSDKLYCAGQIDCAFAHGTGGTGVAGCSAPYFLRQPYDQLLMGLAGIVCALLVVWAFCRN